MVKRKLQASVKRVPIQRVPIQMLSIDVLALVISFLGFSNATFLQFRLTTASFNLTQALKYFSFSIRSKYLWQSRPQFGTCCSIQIKGLPLDKLHFEQIYTMPNLRSLQLRAPLFSYLGSDYLKLSERLTCLQIVGINELPRELLFFCPNLVKLTIHCGSKIVHFPFEGVHLRQLQKLDISESPYLSLPDFSLCPLRVLKLKTMQSLPFVGSLHHLRKLFIQEGVTFNFLAYNFMLNMFPHITHLHIDHLHWDCLNFNGFPLILELRSLFIGSSKLEDFAAFPLLPYLETLEIHGSYKEPRNRDVLALLPKLRPFKYWSSSHSDGRMLDWRLKTS